MITKEFVQSCVDMYGITKEEVLALLDEYLLTRNNIKFAAFSEWPDFNLPSDFVHDANEPTAFENWLQIKLWSWTEEFDSNHSPL